MALERRLGFLEVFCISSGAMISSGLFILPGLAHAKAGPAVIFSYVLAGLIAGIGMLSIAEITTAMPKAGGDYFFISRTMGPAVGTVAGLLSWFSLTLKSSFALVGLSALLAPFVPWHPFFTALLGVIIFGGLNIWSVGEVSRLQVVLVLFMVVLMGWFIGAGLPMVRLDKMVPFLPFGLTAVFSTAGFVFISYGGLLKIVAVAEEVVDPGKTIPRAMAASVIMVVFLYVLMVFVTSGVLDREHLDGSLTPISDASKVFMGPTGSFFMSLAAILAFITTANAGILAASRYLFSLSRDRLIPERLGVLHQRWGTPHVAILFTCFVMICSLALALEDLVKTASCVLILSYILTFLCLIILRESRLVSYRPSFQSPLYPYLQVVGLCGFVFLLLEMSAGSLFLSAILILGGLFFYWFYGRIKAEREFALIYLVDRLLDRDLASGVLEGELRDIVRERDLIKHDRFDQLAEAAPVLDLLGAMTHQEFFSLMALKAHEAFGEDVHLVREALDKQRHGGSTILIPGIAVYDIVVPEKGRLELIVARSDRGIDIPGEPEPVKAFFLLLVAQDQRFYYLRAITAIAQIIQNPKFWKRWTTVTNPDGLRHILLLGERLRDCGLGRLENEEVGMEQQNKR